MAFKKTLAERLFNISKMSTQTLRNCRISSSAVHTRPAPKAREASIAPEPGDNAINRRFLHKKSAPATFQKPEMWSLPMGENLMEKLKVMAIGPDRIRLDGLAPPQPETECSPAVAKAIQDLIPIPGVEANPNDPRLKELEHMETHKFEIDRKAESLVRKELWLGLGYLVAQTAGFMRLTFWELSWDVMEPICFYVTSVYFMAGYAFFLRTSKEPSFEGFFQSRFHAKQKRLMKLENFDLGRYNQLRSAFYRGSSSSEVPSSTAFDGAKRFEFGSIHG